jgi:mRNA interferase MazF
MDMNKYDIWLSNLNPQRGTEVGKVRPVLIIQSDLLNKHHSSTIICPITTNLLAGLDIMRVRIQKDEGGLEAESEVIIDQIRAIDNKRLFKKIGSLPFHLKTKVERNLKIVLDLEN